ncbi:MAG: aminotransferase class IV [Planctomycetota bacterium]
MADVNTETAAEPRWEVFLNGAFVAPERATVSVFDAGFQHAVGVFATVSVYGGVAFRLREHLELMAASAVQLGLAREMSVEPLAEAVRATITHNGLAGLERARIRVTVTPGAVSMLREKRGESGDRRVGQTVCIVPEPAVAYDPAYFDDGITALFYKQSANPFDDLAGHKTLAYWGRLRSLRQAAAMEAGEALWLSVTNHVTCGAISNVILVKDGQLVTPLARGETESDALPAPVRPGVTRAAVLELAETAGLTVTKKLVSVDEVLDADEVMLTNSGWGVLPVSRMEQKVIGDGKAGPVTRGLRTALLGLIERECSAEADA